MLTTTTKKFILAVALLTSAAQAVPTLRWVGNRCFYTDGGPERLCTAKWADLVSVKDLGAICNNGVADDTPAVAAAIATGRPVVTPNSTCRTTGSLGTIPAGSIIVGGALVGSGGSVTLASTNTWTGPNTFTPSTVVSGVTATGNSTSAGGTFTGGATGSGVVAVAGGGGTPAKGSLLLTPQAAPSAPVDGNCWIETTSNTLKCRINAVTDIIYPQAGGVTLGSANTWTAKNDFVPAGPNSIAATFTGIGTGVGLTAVGGNGGIGQDGIDTTGSGSGSGIGATGGASSGLGGLFTGGAPNGMGLQGLGTGTGVGLYGLGGLTNAAGVQGQGVGNGVGVRGVGGGSSGTGSLSVGGYFTGGVVQGRGVYAVATGTAPGVDSFGSDDGAGTQGVGGPTSGPGVKGTGGTPNGVGVLGQGTGTGFGGNFTGGGTSGTGVNGTGVGTGAGVAGTGGATSGSGVIGTGGTGNSRGGSFTGAGSGAGVAGFGGATGAGGLFATGGTAEGALVLTPQAAPSAPSNGAIWVETTSNTLKSRINGVTQTVFPQAGVGQFMSATTAVAQTIAVSPTIVIVVFGTVEVDINGLGGTGLNTGTGRYTIPTTGYYLIQSSIASSGAANSWTCYIYKNAVAVRSYRTAVSNLGCTVNAALAFTAGDIVDIRIKHSDTGSTQALSGVAVENWFNVKQIQ